MTSKLAKFMLFALIGLVIAACFAIKLLFGLVVLLCFILLYLLSVRAAYQRLTQRPSGLVALDGQALDQELEPTRVYYRRAMKRWEQGNLAGAVSDFELAIADAVCGAETYYQYALLLLETGNAIDAVVRLEQAINQAHQNQEVAIQAEAAQALSRLHRKFPQLARL